MVKKYKKYMQSFYFFSGVLLVTSACSDSFFADGSSESAFSNHFIGRPNRMH